MKLATESKYDYSLYYRLISLWVICEAFAGGIMHGLKIPFTGMIVSGLAVMCIILIAWHVPSRNAIIKATIIVAVFKLMLSPHSPPTAYIAVFFQGLLGQLLFINKKYFRASSILLASLALAESALQRILVLLILYGNDFWTALNKYIQKLTGENTISNYSLWIAEGYIIIHVIVGVIIGWNAATLAKRSSQWAQLYPGLIFTSRSDYEVVETKLKKKKKVKIIFIILWVILLAMFIQSYFMPSQAVIPKNIVVNIFLRTILIILSWQLLVSPFVMRLLKTTLIKQQTKNQQLVNTILKLLPETKYIFKKSWDLSKGQQLFKRFKFFTRILLVNILYSEEKKSADH